MRKIFCVLFLVLAAKTAVAQEAFSKNKTLLDFQVGASNIGATFGGGIHYGVTPLLSVGFNFAYQTIDPKIKWFTAYVPQFSADYHFGKKTKTDWYTGASVGYCFWQTDDATNYNSGGCALSSFDDKHRRDVIWNAHVGFRYFIFEKAGLQAQVGVGNVVEGKIGICFKF